MKNWLRRIRGVVGMGLTWAAGWFPVGAVIGLVMGAVFPGATLGILLARWAGMFAVLGFLGGTTFSAILRAVEGHRRFDELSLPRFAASGAVGGLLLGGLAVFAGLLGPGLSGLDAIIVGSATLLGSGSAAASLAIARKTADRELLAGDSRDADGELAEDVRPLLGGSS